VVRGVFFKKIGGGVVYFAKIGNNNLKRRKKSKIFGTQLCFNEEKYFKGGAP